MTMENGDRYTGRIMSVIDGVLELDSEYAGVVKLPASDVDTPMLDLSRTQFC